MGVLELAVGVGAATAATGIAGSIQQSQSIDDVNRRNAENAAATAAANTAIAEEESRDRAASLARQSDAYAAVIRTSAESRGTLGTRVESDLQAALSRRTSLEDARISMNLQATKNAIAAGSVPNFIPRGSAVLDAFGGALGGLQTGLGLYSSLTNLQLSKAQLGQAQSQPIVTNPYGEP
jgi:hypothetical protein